LVRLFQEIQDQRPPATSEATVEPDPAEGFGRRIATATLAEIYAGQGMFDRAIDIYQRLLERDPGNEVIRSRLAALESGP
jgi:tetratricopeptide (TPR) repeat protein